MEQYYYSPICPPFNHSLSWFGFTDTFITPKCNENDVNVPILRSTVKILSHYAAVSDFLNKIRDHLRKVSVNKPIELDEMCLWVLQELPFAVVRPL